MGNTTGKPIVFTEEGGCPALLFCPVLDTRCSICFVTVLDFSYRPSTDVISGPVNLNHFRLLRVVGKGAFGKVRIVERKDSGLTFALKYIRKDESESLV